MLIYKIEDISIHKPILYRLALKSLNLIAMSLILIAFSPPAFSKDRDEEKASQPTAGKMHAQPAPKPSLKAPMKANPKSPPTKQIMNSPKAQSEAKMPAKEKAKQASKVKESPPTKQIIDAPKAQSEAKMPAKEKAKQASKVKESRPTKQTMNAPKTQSEAKMPAKEKANQASKVKERALEATSSKDKGVKKDFRPKKKGTAEEIIKNPQMEKKEPAESIVKSATPVMTKKEARPIEGARIAKPGSSTIKPGVKVPKDLKPVTGAVTPKDLSKARTVAAAGLVAGAHVEARKIRSVPLQDRLIHARVTHECFLLESELFYPAVLETLVIVPDLDLTIYHVDDYMFDQLLFLPNLTVLRIYGGNAYYIPDSLAQLPNLVTLDLSGLGLRELPLGITRVFNLQRLILDDNDLRTLPPEIANLSNLRSLSVENNRLEFLPLEITTLGLRELYLAGNPYLDLSQREFRIWLNELARRGADIDLG